jgi:chromosome segregation ATPase
MAKLKNLSTSLDQKITHIKVKQPRESPPEMDEKRLLNELECVTKMGKVLETEVSILKNKMSQKTGYDKVVEMQKAIALNVKLYEETKKKVALQQKQVKELEKQLEKVTQRNEKGVPQLEENDVLKMIQKENNKGKELDKKIVAEAESMGNKEGLITKLMKKVETHEKKVNEFKKNYEEAIKEAEKNGEVPVKIKEADANEIAELKSQLNELKDKIVSEGNKFKKEYKENFGKLKEFKDQFKELDQVIFFNSKII